MHVIRKSESDFKRSIIILYNRRIYLSLAPARCHAILIDSLIF